jgi:hypothetical protein
MEMKLTDVLFFFNSIGKKKCKHGMDKSGHCIRV